MAEFPTPEGIETAARALHEVVGHRPWEQVHEEHRKRARVEADAAVRACLAHDEPLIRADAVMRYIQHVEADAPEWEKANATLKHEAREARAEAEHWRREGALWKDQLNDALARVKEARAEAKRLLAAARAVASPTGKTVEQAERIAREALAGSGQAAAATDGDDQ